MIDLTAPDGSIWEAKTYAPGGRRASPAARRAEANKLIRFRRKDAPTEISSTVNPSRKREDELSEVELLELLREARGEG